MYVYPDIVVMFPHWRLPHKQVLSYLQRLKLLNGDFIDSLLLLLFTLFSVITTADLEFNITNELQKYITIEHVNIATIKMTNRETMLSMYKPILGMGFLP